MGKKRLLKKGFTLIEIIIVIAILMIVLTASFSLFSFGLRIFPKGENQYAVQHSVRMASKYISEELRTAKSVYIIDNLPSESDLGDFNYIFVENNTIKHLDSKSKKIIDVLKSGEPNLNPESLFQKKGSNILAFEIKVELKGQTFEIKTDIVPLNLAHSDSIGGSATGKVVKYSNPIFDDGEIVRLDALVLDIKKNNTFLEISEDGFILSPPPFSPNQLNLLEKGEYGSNISWTSNNTAIIDNSGKLMRSRDMESAVSLEATISSGVNTTKRLFNIKVKPLLDLEIRNTDLMSATNGTYYEHVFSAYGGNLGYIFSLSNEDAQELYVLGLEMDDSGRLFGVPENVVESYEITFLITVTDNHTSPESKTEEVSLTINP